MRRILVVLTLLALGACGSGDDDNSRKPVTVASATAERPASSEEPPCPVTAEQMSGLLGAPVTAVPGQDTVTCLFRAPAAAAPSGSIAYGAPMTTDQLAEQRRSYAAEGNAVVAPEAAWGPNAFTVSDGKLAQGFLISGGRQLVVTVTTTSADRSLAALRELVSLLG